jgi:hypothetical protein
MQNINDLNEAIGKEARRIEEDSIHSAKSHFNAADIWNKRHYWFGVPATMFGAAAGAAMIKELPEIAGILSLTATILTGLMTFLKPTELAATHKTAADQYLVLRNDARVFREVDLIQIDDTGTLSDMLKALSQRRNELNQGSPIVPRAAFEKARKGIMEGETNYKADQEI